MHESRLTGSLPVWKFLPLVLIYTFFLESVQLPAAEPADRGDFVNRIYRDETGDHRYAVFVPADYTPDREWPVIMWLHGASARGRDGRSILVAGLGPNVHFRRTTFPFIVVFPQCENLRSRLLGGWTDQREDADRALRILEDVEQAYRVDPKRRVLAGVSMGAFGVWSIAARTSDMWSGIVPVSGGGPLTITENLKHIPVWAFHALDDQVVPPEASQTLVDAIKEKGGRAFYSELPNGGHNIGSRVFAQDDIYKWLLDPTQEPQQKFNWSVDLKTTSDLQHEVPFVPGAEVDRSVLVHLGTDVLQAFSQAIPEQVPAESMQGSQGGQTQMAGNGFMRFQVSVAGIQYSGQIRQARLEPLPDNQLRFWLGIQPLTMNVLGTEIQGRLLRAEAGPMQIVIGSQRPVWLSMVVRPQVVERKLKLELVSAEFPIENDNWYVTEPAGLSVRPLPLMRGTISQRLTDGLYAKKGEIEQQVVSSVPRILQQIEEQVATQLNRTITFGRWPMPVWQPRARFWLSEVTIDQSGLTLALGTTLAALAPQIDKVELRYYQGSAERPNLDSRGIQIAMSDEVVTAWTEILATSEVRYFHVEDFHFKPLQRLGEREFLETAMPSLMRRHANSELQSVLSFEQPMSIRALDGAGDIAREMKISDQQARTSAFQLRIPEMLLTVSARTSPSEAWTPIAEFPLSWQQDFGLVLQAPTHRRRTVHMASLHAGQASASGRILDQEASDDEHDMRPELIAEQFQLGMEETFPTALDKAITLRHRMIGGMPFAFDDIAWKGRYVTINMDPLALQIRNESAEPITYDIGYQGKNWSQPYTLPPQMMHEFPASLPLTWRSRERDRELRYTLPAGSVVVYRGGEVPIVLVNEDEPDSQTAWLEQLFR